MSISGNSESTSAAKKKGINSVKSKATSTDIVDVDENVAEVIGIQDNFDLTYGEYRTLLKEAALRGRDVNTTIDHETTEKITQEYRRIKGKEGQIRPKVKKVSFQKVFNTKPPKVAGLIGGSSSSLALRSPDALKEKEEKEEDKKEMKMDKYVSSSLTKITKNIFDVEKVVVTILGDERTKAKRDNQARRDAKRKEKEEAGEKKVAKESKGFLQGFKPKIPFMDQIKRYFGNILAGGAVLGLLNWVNDPENQEKIESFTTFLQDSVPVILAGFAALVAFDLGMKLLGFVNLFLPLVKGLLGVLGGLGKGLLGAGKALLGVAGVAPVAAGALAIAGTLFAMKGAHDLIRNYITGGADFSKQHDVLNQKLIDAGMNIQGGDVSDMSEAQRNRRGSSRRGGRSEEQEKLFQEVQAERERLNLLKKERDAQKDAVDERMKKELEALKENADYYTKKEVGHGRKKRTAFVATEEGKAKEEEIKEQGRKEKLRLNLQARMDTLDTPEFRQMVEEANITDPEQIEFTKWLILTHGEKLISNPAIADDPKEYSKFLKDTGRPPGGSKPEVTPKTEEEKVKPRTLTEAEFTEARNNADILDEYNDEIGNSRNYEEYLESKGLLSPGPKNDKKMGVDAEELPIAPVQKTQPVPDPPGATDKDDVTVMPGPEAGPNASTASSQPAADVAFFSSEDTGNDSILGVKGLYNVTAVAT